MAGEHWVFHTANVLRLDYSKLKQLLESSGAVKRSGATKAAGVNARRIRSEAPPAFMELLASPTTAAVSECLIELEGRRGKMRIHWQGKAAPDLRWLRRAFWESLSSVHRLEDHTVGYSRFVEQSALRRLTQVRHEAG
jgi:hypothetical protein